MASEEMSKGMTILCIVGGLGVAAVGIYLDHYDLPPVSWVNAGQAAVMGGYYSPKLTFLILFLLLLIPVGIVALIVKAVKSTAGGSSRLADVDDLDEVEPIDRPPPRRRRPRNGEDDY